MNLFKRFLGAFLLCFIILPASYSAQVSRQHADTIINGNLINASDLGGEFDSLVNESNSQDTRLTNIESGTATISGTKTFTGTNTHTGANSFLGHFNLGRSSDQSSPAEGDFWFNTTGHLAKVYNGTSTLTLATTNNLPPVLQGYLGGYILTNDGTTPDTDIDVAKGVAADSTGVDYISQAAIVKRVSTAWAVGTGSGCLDTGTIPTSGTVHIFAIKRTDTNVSDVLCSTSLTPAMPTNYTEKRRIGSILTDSFAHILAFTQTGDQFDLATPLLDVSVTNQGTTATLRNLSVPTGLNVYALMNVIFSNGSASQQAIYIHNPDLPDNAPSTTLAPLATFITENNSATSDYAGGQISVLTNIASQITTRATANSLNLKIATLGWIDNRGKFD